MSKTPDLKNSKQFYFSLVAKIAKLKQERIKAGKELSY